MISRESAKAIADAYHAKFTGTYRRSFNARSYHEFKYNSALLYDFLYVSEFDGWLLNSVKAIPSHASRRLLEFVMKFHTGESLVVATPEWSWEARKALGQRFL